MVLSISGCSRTTSRGFTLIELLICLSMLAILTTVGVPSFQQWLGSSERSNAMQDVWHALFLARNEAIKRNSVVVLCKTSDGVQCNNTPGNWSQGWLVFDNLDHDEPAQIDAGETILRRYAPPARITVTSNRQTFAFRPYSQGGVNGTLVFCDRRGAAEARAIIISHTGRPRMANKDASNHRLQCPSSY